MAASGDREWLWSLEGEYGAVIGGNLPGMLASGARNLRCSLEKMEEVHIGLSNPGFPALAI